MQRLFYLIVLHVLATYSHHQVRVIPAEFVSLRALFCVTCPSLTLIFEIIFFVGCAALFRHNSLLGKVALL